jgi:hypothetical protein
MRLALFAMQKRTFGPYLPQERAALPGATGGLHGDRRARNLQRPLARDSADGGPRHQAEDPIRAVRRSDSRHTPGLVW